MLFDHEKLDVYQQSLQFAAWVYRLVKPLSGVDRHVWDHLLQTSQSIPLDIAEGNGKRSDCDRKHFLEIARGSAFECAAALDVFILCEAIAPENVEEGKQFLYRIICMLSRMTEPVPQVREAESACGENPMEPERETGEEGDVGEKDNGYQCKRKADYEHEHEKRKGE